MATYKNNFGNFALTASFTDSLEMALVMPIEHYERQREDFEHLASLLEAEPVKVVADYTLTTIDGNELPPIEKSDQLVREFLQRVANGNDED
ncbi:hypothetical protein [Streptococcus minor]